jgi:hypothetical protein
METLRIDPQTADDALLAVARVLDVHECWLYQRRYHFSVAYGWSIAFSPESAGRFRLEACRWTRPVDTVWVLADDDDRLAGAVIDLLDEIEEFGGELWQTRTRFVGTFD